MGGAGMGGWMFLWILLALAVVVTAGVVAARALGGRRVARSTGKSTCKARSSWKTDHGAEPGGGLQSQAFLTRIPFGRPAWFPS